MLKMLFTSGFTAVACAKLSTAHVASQGKIDIHMAEDPCVDTTDDCARAAAQGETGFCDVCVKDDRYNVETCPCTCKSTCTVEVLAKLAGTDLLQTVDLRQVSAQPEEEPEEEPEEDPEASNDCARALEQGEEGFCAVCVSDERYRTERCPRTCTSSCSEVLRQVSVQPVEEPCVDKTDDCVRAAEQGEIGFCKVCVADDRYNVETCPCTCKSTCTAEVLAKLAGTDLSQTVDLRQVSAQPEEEPEEEPEDPEASNDCARALAQGQVGFCAVCVSDERYRTERCPRTCTSSCSEALRQVSAQPEEEPEEEPDACQETDDCSRAFEQGEEGFCKVCVSDERYRTQNCPCTCKSCIELSGSEE